MVYQHVNMPHIIDHEKNMGFLDLDHTFQWLALWFVNRHRECNTNWKLNSFKLKGQIGWYHGNPRKEDFLILEFSFEYSRVNHIDHHFFFITKCIPVHCLVGLGLEASWPPSQSSVVNCAVTIQGNPRSLKIQMNS